MARTLNKLSDVAVKAAKKPGRHSDGGGLYLNVSPAGTKSWLFMWTVDGKRREMGMGSYPAVSLSRARAKANDCREAIADGRDPIAEKAKEAEPTFGECADRFIESIKAEWRNDKHEYQWRQTLGDSYCQSLRSKRVSQITTEDVLKVLTPVWTAKSETASRLRGRIERVLEYAKVKGWRSGRTPQHGAATFVISYPAARSSSAATSLLWPTATCLPSWSSCGLPKPWRRGHWNSRS